MELIDCKMKTFRYILAALLVFTLAACNREPMQDSLDGDAYELIATIAPDGPQTRTILMDNPGVRVETTWAAGDAITIFGPSGECMTLNVAYGDIIDSGKSTILRSSTALPSGNITALYPGGGNASVSGGKINTVFPNTQHYTITGGVPQPDPAVSIMAGSGSVKNGVAFFNVMAVLKIGHAFDDETTVTSVTFRDLSGKAVSGSISIDPSDNYSSQVSGGSATLTLDCGEGVELEPGETGVFYMIVPAREYPSGVEITFVTSAGEQFSRQAGSSNGITLGRGVIYPVGEISNREYVAGKDASVLADNAHLMTPELLRQMTVLSSDSEYVRDPQGGFVYLDMMPMSAPAYSILIPNDMPFNEGDYLVFEATDDLPTGGVYQIIHKDTPYADENHSRIEAHMTTDFAKAFKKLEYGAKLYDDNGEMIEGAGEDMDLSSYLSEVHDAEGNPIQYSISEQGQIQISRDDFEEALTKALTKIDKSISSPKLSMTITDPSKVCEATLGAKLTVNMKAGIKVDDGELQWVHFMFNPQVKFSGNFAIKGAVSYSKSFHLITLYFVPGIPVAPGVVLTPEIEIRGSIGLGGEIVFSTSIEYTYDMGRFGFSYNNGAGFTFHHFEAEPDPKDDFKTELGTGLTGTIYAQGTLTFIPSISLFRVFRAGIYTDCSLKLGMTVGTETIDNNIYKTRKLFLTPEIAFSPYVASMGGVFSTKWDNLIPKIEFDPLWERYVDPVIDYSSTIDLIAPGHWEQFLVCATGTGYYRLDLNTQKFFGQMLGGYISTSLDGFTYSCKSLKPTLDDWDVCVIFKNGDYSGDWKHLLANFSGHLALSDYSSEKLMNMREQNRYTLMTIPHNQKEEDDISCSGELMCPGEFLPGEPRVLHFACVNKSNGRIYTIKESYPVTYYWPNTPDGPWWNAISIQAETYYYYKEHGWQDWPSDLPLPF